MEENKSTLPLGILRQAVMKLDSFITDMKECIEDEDTNPEDKEQFEKMAEVAGDMQAIIVNMVSREISEEDFLNEHIDPDQLEPYPGTEESLLDETID